MYGLDISCLLPFSGKALAPIVKSTNKFAIAYLIASLLVSVSPKNRVM